MRSARAAIAIRYMAIVIPLMCAFAAGLDVWLQGELEEELEMDLGREADLVLARAQKAVSCAPSREAAVATIASQLVFIEHPLTVTDERGLLARSPRADEATEKAFTSGGHGLHVTRKGGTLTVDVATSLAEVDETIGEYRIGSALALVLMLVLAGGGGYILAKAALRPVDEIAQAAARIDARSLDARVPSRPIDDELGRLVVTLNRMLGRIEQGVQTARRFTQDASHELKTPVAAIKGTVEVALRAPRKPDEDEHAFHAIARECERLERVVRDLLTIARADAGALVEKREPFDLRVLLDETAEVGEILAHERHSRLHASRGEEELPVEGDLARLRQVALNLVDNAIRYGREQGNVWISSSRDRETVLLVVEDDGGGVPEADRPRVFERFFRSRRDVPGVGLGLAIARAIVEEHGGTIVCEERTGGGARFVVRLPRRRSGP